MTHSCDGVGEKGVCGQGRPKRLQDKLFLRLLHQSEPTRAHPDKDKLR